MAPGTPAPVNGTVSPNYMDQPMRIMQFNPALVALVMAMIISFFVVGFATGLLKKCIRPAEANPEDGFVHRRGPGSKSPGGLDPEILEALPRVQFKDLPADKYSDCSVCLGAFDATDSLRLLPVCSHAFHSDCIDVWFLSQRTCPLCRACLTLHMEKASGEGDAGDGEQEERCVPDGSDVVEVVIEGDTEQDRSRSTAISESREDRTGGAPVANSSIAEEEDRVNAHVLLRSTAGESFKPAVRVVIAPEKAAVLASRRRSNSVGTDLQLIQPSYVVDSEGTQHNRNYQTHAIDVEDFLKDHHGAHAHPSGSSSRLPVDTGASNVTQPISRLGPT